MNRRAFAILQIKSIDAEQRILTGIASSATADLMDDVVEPGGAQFKLPIPLLWQHNSREPIGEVFAAKVTDAGIEIQARLAKTDEPGALKTRLDDAWQAIKIGLVKGLSIGFKSLEESYDKTSGGYHFLKWLWLELSVVTIPANTDASILSIKAASGRHQPGASGRVHMQKDKPMTKKSYADQIASWEATRAAKTARMDELLTKSGDAGVTLDEAEQEEHDTLADDVAKIDAQLLRLRAAEAREKAAAKPVAGADPTQAAASRSGSHVITVEKKLPPGIGFARGAMCIAASKGSPDLAERLVKQYYPDDPAVLAMVQRAAVPAGNTQTAGWASELVYASMMDDFIEFLRPRTIVGKIPGLRRVPFNVRVTGASAGTTGYWVGEGLPVPVSKMTTFTTSLTWAKIEALAILTKEEVRFSNPSAEAKVRDDLARAIIYRMDIDFIDPGKAAVANVSPASITFNTAPIAPTAATAAAFRTDFATLLGTFATLLLDPSDIVLIMSTVRALNLSLMINTLGVQSFPGLTMAGGTLLGFPVITSEAMVALGSPDEDIIVAVKAGDIYLADDGVVTVEASDQASIEMLDVSLVQTGIVGTGASLVSLWQSGLLGIKANREVTWKLRRTGAARYIGPAAYVA